MVCIYICEVTWLSDFTYAVYKCWSEQDGVWLKGDYKKQTEFSRCCMPNRMEPMWKIVSFPVATEGMENAGEIH